MDLFKYKTKWKWATWAIQKLVGKKNYEISSWKLRE
jgi:hypothetical protein